MLHTLLAQAAEAPVAWYEEGWFVWLIALAILVVPYLLGTAAARSLRMADYGWKLGVIFIAVTAGVVIALYGAFVSPAGIRLGIDLSGGVKLIYELDQSKLRSVNIDQVLKRLADEANTAGHFGKKKAEVIPGAEGRLEITLPTSDAEKATAVKNAIDKLDFKNQLGVTLNYVDQRNSGGNIVLTYEAERSSNAVDMDKLIAAISKRVNPGGQREVAIRRIGADQIEVAIPNVDQAEIDLVKKKISTAGALEFRILADHRFSEHNYVIEAAKQNMDNPSNDVSDGTEIVGQWIDLPTDPTQLAGLHLSDNFVTRQLPNGTRQVLAARDSNNVTGAYLTKANAGLGDEGLEVNFSFNSQGADLFGNLTGDNLPVNGQAKELAIILDNTLMSVAGIRSRITDNGRITGSFSEKDVQFIVDVLNAGALPAALQKEPVSEQRISAELGADTIRNRALSMIVSTGAVLVFMLFYYRFAGIVANAAVMLNLVLVLALMIIFKAAFTLAGLAGLVLSVGMAVNSNVLIYERMREEKERGAALRMVIRNGFGRAMATIIDTHSTTIITGVVLYAIGTEQLRGFAVTLVMGLVVNLFTAVFCARVVFDIAERQRWLKELKMLRLFGDTNIDFVSIMKPAICVSILIAAAGIVALFARGRSILDVDFTGGSEVQIALNPKDAMDVSEVRKSLENPDVERIMPDVTVNAVTTSKGQENTQFVIRTSNEKIKDVESELGKVFGERLRHYKVAKVVNQHAIEAKATKTEPAAEAKAAPGAGALKEAPVPPTVPPTTPDKNDQTDSSKAKANEADAKQPDAGKSNDGKADDKKAEPKKTDDEKAATPAAEKKSSSLLRMNRGLLALALPTDLLADEKSASSDSSAKSEPSNSKSQTSDSKPQTPSAAGASKADASKADASNSDALKRDATKTDATTADAPKADVPKADPSSKAAADTTLATKTDGTETSKSSSPSSTSSGQAPSTSSGQAEQKELTTRPSVTAARDPFAGGTEVTLEFDEPIKYDSLKELLGQSIDSSKVNFSLSNPEYATAPNRGYKTWALRVSVPTEEATAILNKFKANIESTPVFLADATISGRVAGDTQMTALYALVASMVMIVVYIWIRFQNVIYGIGAIVATVHDVLITVAGVALSYYLAGVLGFLLVDPFKISLNVVAALLTIVGYSISDTIVIFDRIREVRGKSPDLTAEMINKSVNQTLSRTVLTVFTVLLVTVILYIAGGQAIHAFAFTMLIGLISGTYSSVYIAAPCLLWLKPKGGQNNK